VRYALLDVVFCLDFSLFFSLLFPCWVFSFYSFIYLKFSTQSSCYNDTLLIIK